MFPTTLVHSSLEDTAPAKISLLEKLLGRTREAPELTDRYIQMLITSAGEADEQVNLIQENLAQSKKTQSYTQLKILDESKTRPDHDTVRFHKVFHPVHQRIDFSPEKARAEKLKSLLGQYKQSGTERQARSDNEPSHRGRNEKTQSEVNGEVPKASELSRYLPKEIAEMI